MAFRSTLLSNLLSQVIVIINSVLGSWHTIPPKWLHKYLHLDLLRKLDIFQLFCLKNLKNLTFGFHHDDEPSHDYFSRRSITYSWGKTFYRVYRSFNWHKYIRKRHASLQIHDTFPHRLSFKIRYILVGHFNNLFKFYLLVHLWHQFLMSLPTELKTFRKH